MVTNIITNEKTSLEIELVGIDRSLAQILSEKLSADSSVEYAAYKVDHPTMAAPKLILKTKKADASKVLIEKLEEIKKDVLGFQKEFAAKVD